MRKLIGKPERVWIITVAIASVLLLATLFVPLWRMELVAPQYPAGLVMKAYGYKFAEDPDTYYDDIREINGLNHYIGMDPIEEVTEMLLFIPAVIGLAIMAIATAFVTWKRKWLKALNPGAFTPKVFGSTKVWNFNTENSFEIGFYLMVAAALVVSLPPIIGWLRSRLDRQATVSSGVAQAPESARAS